jgi:hypothetical protein
LNRFCESLYKKGGFPMKFLDPGGTPDALLFPPGFWGSPGAGKGGEKGEKKEEKKGEKGGRGEKGGKEEKKSREIRRGHGPGSEE